MRAAQISGLMTVIAVMALGAAPAAAQGGRKQVSSVSFTVPSIVKMVVDSSTLDAAGSPLVRVISNDPAFRTLGTQGVTPEVLRRPGVRYEAEGRGKGGEAAIRGDTTVEPGLVRYTIVRP